MKKVITTMLVAAMVLSMAMPTSAATITRKKSTGTTASTTKVSGDYSLKMVDKTLQFIRGGKVVSSIETKDGKITLRKSSAGGISVVFTDANGKRRNITLGKQKTVVLSGTFVQVSVDKALGSSYEVEMEKGSKVTNFYAKGAAKVTLNGSVTTLNVTSSNANVAANGTVSRAYAVNKKAISGLASGKITQTSTGTSASGSVNTTGSGSSSSSNTTVNSGSGSGSSSSSGSSGIIINGGGSNNGGNTTSKRNPKLTASSTAIPTYDEGTVLDTIPLAQFGLKAMYGNTEVAGKFAFKNATTSKVVKGVQTYSVIFTPTDSKTYNSATINVKIEGKEVAKTQTLAEAKKAIEEAMPNWAVNNATTEKEIEELAAGYLKDGITAKAEVTKVEATTKADGSIEGTIILTRGTETAEIKVKLTIPKLSALDEAAEKVEAALKNIPASKDIDKAAVEAVINPINEEYKDIAIVVESVTPNETDKKIVAKVTLTEDGKDPKTVEYTWTYTDPAENTDLADAVKAVEALKGPYADDTVAKEEIVKAAKAINQDIQVNTDNVVLSEDGTTVAGEVELSLTIGDKTETAKANFEAKIEQGEADKAVAPTFETDLDEATQNIIINKENPAVLTVKAVSTDGGDISYQWYKNSVKDPVADEKLAIPNATGETYAPTTTGTAFYYVIATNTLGESKASTPSKCARVIVSYPEGSAQEPVIANTSKLSDASYNQRDTISALEVDASVDQGELSYQWYKTDSAVAENGTKIDGATLATYTPPKELGINYYYCVVTNTDASVTEGMKEVSVKTRAVEIKVTATVGATIDPVANEDGTTTQITFTFAREIPNLETATKDDFTLTGKGTHTDGDCTLKIDRVVPRADNKMITLDISGVDMDEDAEVAFTKTFDGFSITPTKATIDITKTTAPTPTEKLVVKEFSAVNGSNKSADTTQLKVTFNKKVNGITAKDFAISGLQTDKDGVTTGLTKVTVAADGMSAILDVVLAAPTGSASSATLELTKAGDAEFDPAKKVTTTAYYDTTPPTIEEVHLNTDNPKELFVYFSEEVAVTGTAANIFTYSGAAAGIDTVAVSTNKEKCVLVTLKDNGTLNTTLTYKGTGGDIIKDVSVKGNEVATKTAMIVTASDPDAANASTVTIKEVETKTDSGKIAEVYAKVNTPIKVVEKEGQTATDAGKELAAGFTVIASDGKSYKPETVTIVTTAPRTVTGAVGSYFKFTFKSGEGPAADAVITDVQFNPEKVVTVEVVSFFKPETKVDEIVVEAGASKPLESDLKVVSASATSIDTRKPVDESITEKSRGDKNYGKYTVDFDGTNTITVTAIDTLVNFNSSDVGLTLEQGGPRPWCGILIELNKEITGDKGTETIQWSKDGVNWSAMGTGTSGEAKQYGATNDNSICFWAAPDKEQEITRYIKTKDGETPITIKIKTVPYSGTSTAGMAKLGVTATQVKDNDAAKGATVSVDAATVPEGAKLYYLATTWADSWVEYNDPFSQIGTKSDTPVEITETDGKYTTSTIERKDFKTIETNNRAASDDTWEDNDKWAVYVHVYAVVGEEGSEKVVGYGVANVDKTWFPAEAEPGSVEPMVASINTNDKNDDITIGASDEKKD